ncbi:hypothetical protein ACCS67_27640 [Rhizobium brockwellii]|uniref:hypothetical protein n=1 Tax=Rhizobium brockwellii TaxID=3019932 RepID=UPI003F985390
MQHPQRSRRLRVHVFASSYRRIASFGSALLPAAKSSRRAIGKDGFFPHPEDKKRQSAIVSHGVV